MTRRPVFFSTPRPVLLVLLAGVALLAPAAHAARMTLSGEDLDLSVPCTGQVRVVVDPAMKDGATLDSSSMTQVAMHTGKEEAQSRISIATKACAPNGKLTISISPNTGLTIHDSHDTHFVITGTLASLDASLDSTTMDIEDTQSLDLNMQGASSVHIKSLERAAQIVASGTSTLTADTVQLTALSAQLTQNAAMTLSGSSIDALTLVTADQASATILGHATVATVAANGTGEVNIETVSGPMVRSGKGTVRVGAQNGVIYRPTSPPPAPLPVPTTPAPLPSTPVQAPATRTEATATVPAPIVPAPAPIPAPTVPSAPESPTVPQAPIVTPSAKAAQSDNAPVVTSPAANTPVTATPTTSASASTPITAPQTASPTAPQTSPAPQDSKTPAKPIITPAPESTPAPTTPAPATPTLVTPAPANPATVTPPAAGNHSQGE
ncbi:hypothetical protein [Gluconobacter sphaericus]|uniref:Auto-transporter adhesin head GIN domain-containing protein n=1 Tax=Gluconobacter sphaericus NBRC 12467 TaxID=1307951 RepID=A0AA37W9R7_9PROT|nr:hypothetical protein [Gluconobacter sphaericus]MBF0884849.1 hypothetical protein [Gluconobacter sphaericus]QQX91937.1 hypothetical protein IGS75_05010 [Gluconobacter sphaericus]GBR50415.1 hypothetical protein AA12467_0244 [Gluconobacter sphaericus NBRC 12467]GEB41649.1 hypothetical protein GSP01_04310 [Gluconobacter sphaericus NBRC 12467]GLQ84395.1 hypothetical protein GCM10007872_13030 [Gluconobacter sphaericus NBRC 12467]